MIRVYEITSKGRTLLKNKTLTGFTKNELKPCLQMYKDEAVEGKFLFDASPKSLDLPYKAHIKLLEKMGCIIKDTLENF